MNIRAGRGKQRLTEAEIEKIIQAAHTGAEELRRAAQLPNVDEEGNSECPFAEELYAKKEEAQEKVQGLFKSLHECKAEVEVLIEGCKRDMRVISAREDQLNGDRARAQFSEAEAVLAAKYKALTRLLRRVLEAIRVVDLVLRDAVTKRYPGKIPERWPKMEFSPPSAERGRPSELEPTGADKELEDLFELDRQRQATDSGLFEGAS